MRLSSASLLVLLLCASCGDDDPTGGGGQGGAANGGGGGDAAGAGGAGGDGAGGAGLWEECALVTGEDDTTAECAVFALPADRSDASLGTVNVFVKKVAAKGARRGSLWLLQGGPGGSGVAWESVVPAFESSFPDLDIMIPDHRGTGRSDRLSCPAAENPTSQAGRYITNEEVEGCAALLEEEWGDKLASFNGTQAALDIGELIELTREPGDEPYVYGISYGSQWGHRYLQAFPDQAAGVALEAICVPSCDFLGIEAWFEDLAEVYFDACGQDAFCSSKLGADPWAAVELVPSSLETCEGLDPRFTLDMFKAVGAQVLYGYEDRKLLPAIVYRVNRCSPADVSALNYLVQLLLSPGPTSAVTLMDSDLLGLNVGLIDNFPDEPPLLEDVISSYEEKRIALGPSVRFRLAYDVWPSHPKDDYFGQLAQPDIPVLMLHGALDFIPTSHAQTAADGLGAPLVVLPTAPHGASFQSPLVLGHCGARVLFQFLEDPEAPVDASCTEDILPLEFEISGFASNTFFGTSDAYEGAPGDFEAQVVGSNEAVQRLRDRLRRQGVSL